MRLTKNDIIILLNMGYCSNDIKSIEYRVKYLRNYIITDTNMKRISKKQAICILGKYNWLSGLGRSAFHWSSVRSHDNTDIYFDMSKYFRE